MFYELRKKKNKAQIYINPNFRNTASENLKILS